MAKMREWLSECDDCIPFSGEPTEYTPDLQDIEQSISEAADSAPGPDGVPFRAWKVLKSIAAPVLHSVAIQLTQSSPDAVASENPFFNEAFLTCLGKKAAFTQDGIGAVFLPSSTRPLSVVNADNRLVAAAFRIRISGKVEPWVSPQQRGFSKEDPCCRTSST